jgi:hypothetical protein
VVERLPPGAGVAFVGRLRFVGRLDQVGESNDAFGAVTAADAANVRNTVDLTAYI